MARPDLVVPVAADEQQARTARRGSQRLDESERGRVGPLQVVEEGVSACPGSVSASIRAREQMQAACSSKQCWPAGDEPASGTTRPSSGSRRTSVPR